MSDEEVKAGIALVLSGWERILNRDRFEGLGEVLAGIALIGFWATGDYAISEEDVKNKLVAFIVDPRFLEIDLQGTTLTLSQGRIHLQSPDLSIMDRWSSLEVAFSVSQEQR